MLVRSARLARGWTQRDLADRLHYSRSTISRLETGAQALDDLSALRRLAEVLEITPTALGITAMATIHQRSEDHAQKAVATSHLSGTTAVFLCSEKSALPKLYSLSPEA